MNIGFSEKNPTGTKSRGSWSGRLAAFPGTARNSESAGMNSVYPSGAASPPPARQWRRPRPDD